MKREKIEADVKQILSDVVKGRVAPQDIKNDDILAKTLGVDSIMVLEVLVNMEEVYGFCLEEEDLDFESFATVNNIADLIEKLQEK